MKEVEQLKNIISVILKIQNEIITELAIQERGSREWAENQLKRTNKLFSELSQIKTS